MKVDSQNETHKVAVPYIRTESCDFFFTLVVKGFFMYLPPKQIQRLGTESTLV